MLQNINVGEVVNFTDFIFESRDIVENDDIYERINGKSYIKNSDVYLDELVYIKMLHYNYDGNVTVGEMIVNKAILNETREIFSTLFIFKYQIHSMRLIDDFWIEGDALQADRNSISHNNSSCFCYRRIAKQEKLSNHALGIAIDINPLDNPCTPRNKDGSFDDSLLSDYEKNTLINRKDKAKVNRHIITLGDIACTVFDSVGFECGGIWPLQNEKWPSDWQHFEPNAEKMPIVIKRIEEKKLERKHQ